MFRLASNAQHTKYPTPKTRTRANLESSTVRATPATPGALNTHSQLQKYHIHTSRNAYVHAYAHIYTPRTTLHSISFHYITLRYVALCYMILKVASIHPSVRPSSSIHPSIHTYTHTKREKERDKEKEGDIYVRTYQQRERQRERERKQKQPNRASLKQSF